MQNPDIKKIIEGQEKKARRWAKNRLPRLVGKTAVDHFKDNFRQEGFVDGGLHKWPEVERRKPDSPWYGFRYKGEKRTSYRFKRDRKSGKTLKSKTQKKLNFSRAATRWNILHNGGDLKDSIRYDKTPEGVVILSDLPYAAVQNNGGPIHIFGKKTVQLPPRPFIGHSAELDRKIEETIEKGLDEIFKTQ